MTRSLSIALGIVAGIPLALGLSAMVASRGGTAAPPRIVNDVDGALVEVCIQYCRTFHDAQIETIEDFVNALGDETTVDVVVAKRGEFDFLLADLARRGVRQLDRLRPVVVNMPITPWAKDRFATLLGPGGPVLGTPPARSMSVGPRANDELVPEILAARLLGVECCRLPFYFEGGDILCDERHAFVSPNWLARNQPDDRDHREDLLERIRQAVNKELFLLGDTPGDAPDHHVGMYLTPLGGNRLAVGDPDLGRRLYEDAGEPDGVSIATHDSVYRPFRRVIARLESASLDVIRVPLLLTSMPRVYLSYNNAIVECRSGTPRIYMPVYEMAALDSVARDCFESQGFEVALVRVTQLYPHTGSLRCQVGVIRRRP